MCMVKKHFCALVYANFIYDLWAKFQSMKKIFTLSALSLMVLAANAQITLNQAGYAAWTPGTSTFRGVTNFTATPANGGSWDLSGATYGSAFTQTRTALTMPGLPQVTFGEASVYGSGTFSYATSVGEGITVDGYQRFGESLDRQAIPLGSLTGDTDDSLVFNAQVVTYSAPRTIIAFPATANSTWSSDYNFQTDFAITLGMYMLNNAPCARRTYVERADSVKGWGTMRVNDLNGKVSKDLDVLAVEATIKVKDSFFLNSTPAPAPMLSAFGLTQGQIETTYYTYYYRDGEIDPLLTIEYDDASRSTIASSYAHADRLPLSIKDFKLNNSIKLYPNPSVNGNINIEANELNDGNWSYDVINIAGQKVAAGQLQVAGGKVSISIANYAPGTHYLTLSKNGVGQVIKAITLQ